MLFNSFCNREAGQSHMLLMSRLRRLSYRLPTLAPFGKIRLAPA
jgi:hypothetical protein